MIRVIRQELFFTSVMLLVLVFLRIKPTFLRYFAAVIQPKRQTLTVFTGLLLILPLLIMFVLKYKKKYNLSFI